MKFWEMVYFSSPGWLMVLALALGWAWTRLERRRPSRRTPFVPWGGFDVLVAAFAYLTLMVLAVFVLSPWFKQVAGKAGWAESAATAIPGIGTAVVILVLLYHRYGLWARDLGLTFGRWGRDLLLALTLFSIVLGVRAPMAIGFHQLHEVFHKELKQQELVEEMKSGAPTELAFIAFMALALAPFYEEILFRGYLQPALGRVFRPWIAILIVAAAFSMLHSPTSAFLMTPIMIFPLALALGYAYHRTGRLAAPLMIHLMNNSLAVVAILSKRT